MVKEIVLKIIIVFYLYLCIAKELLLKLRTSITFFKILDNCLRKISFHGTEHRLFLWNTILYKIFCIKFNCIGILRKKSYSYKIKHSLSYSIHTIALVITLVRSNYKKVLFSFPRIMFVLELPNHLLLFTLSTVCAAVNYKVQK